MKRFIVLLLIILMFCASAEFQVNTKAQGRVPGQASVIISGSVLPAICKSDPLKGTEMFVLITGGVAALYLCTNPPSWSVVAAGNPSQNFLGGVAIGATATFQIGPDVCLGRDSAGVLDIGNCSTPTDQSGIIQAQGFSLGQGALTLSAFQSFVNNALSIPLLSSSANNSKTALISNQIVDSVNGINGGLYYPRGALGARLHRAMFWTGSAWINEYETGVSTCNTSTDVPAAGTSSDYVICATTTSAANVASQIGNFTLKPGRNIWFSGYGSVHTTISPGTRWWMGAISGTAANLGGTDNCAGFHCAAFAFSSTSGVTGTNYRCVLNNNVSPTDVDTGVTAAIDTNHYFDAREDSANSRWYFTIDGNPVCGSMTAHLPTALLALANVVDNIGGVSAAGANIAYLEGWVDK